MRYEVYTLRRTSSRTVYAVYDNFASQPVCMDGTQTPYTTTDRRQAEESARYWERHGQSGNPLSVGP